MNKHYLLSLASMALLATACASGGARSTPSGSDAATASAEGGSTNNSAAASGSTRRARGSANLISSEELRQATHGNVYEFVAATRPEWLRTTGASSITRGGGVTAYLDQTRLGGVAALRNIPLNQARAVRFYPASEAQSRFGLDNMAGVIQVETGGR